MSIECLSHPGTCLHRADRLGAGGQPNSETESCTDAGIQTAAGVTVEALSCSKQRASLWPTSLPSQDYWGTNVECGCPDLLNEHLGEAMSLRTKRKMTAQVVPFHPRWELSLPTWSLIVE